MKWATNHCSPERACRNKAEQAGQTGEKVFLSGQLPLNTETGIFKIKMIKGHNKRLQKNTSVILNMDRAFMKQRGKCHFVL